jgi:hypothetical protein
MFANHAFHAYSERGILRQKPRKLMRNRGFLGDVNSLLLFLNPVLGINAVFNQRRNDIKI